MVMRRMTYEDTCDDCDDDDEVDGVLMVMTGGDYSGLLFLEVNMETLTWPDGFVRQICSTGRWC